MTFLKQVLLFIILFTIIECNKKTEDKKVNKIKKTIINKSVNNVKLPITMVFNDKDSLNIIGNIFLKNKIDSVNISKKEVKAKYYYCGKGIFNEKLIAFYKKSNNKNFNPKGRVTTAHNLILKKDTIYLNGKQNIPCFNKNDSVNVYLSIFQIYIKSKKYNLPIIDKIIKLR